MPAFNNFKQLELGFFHYFSMEHARFTHEPYDFEATTIPNHGVRYAVRTGIFPTFTTSPNDIDYGAIHNIEQLSHLAPPEGAYKPYYDDFEITGTQNAAGSGPQTISERILSLHSQVFPQKAYSNLVYDPGTYELNPSDGRSPLSNQAIFAAAVFAIKREIREITALREEHYINPVGVDRKSLNNYLDTLNLFVAKALETLNTPVTPTGSSSSINGDSSDDGNDSPTTPAPADPAFLKAFAYESLKDVLHQSMVLAHDYLVARERQTTARYSSSSSSNHVTVTSANSQGLQPADITLAGSLFREEPNIKYLIATASADELTQQLFNLIRAMGLECLRQDLPRDQLFQAFKQFKHIVKLFRQHQQEDYVNQHLDTEHHSQSLRQEPKAHSIKHFINYVYTAARLHDTTLKYMQTVKIGSRRSDNAQALELALAKSTQRFENAMASSWSNDTSLLAFEDIVTAMIEQELTILNDRVNTHQSGSGLLAGIRSDLAITFRDEVSATTSASRNQLQRNLLKLLAQHCQKQMHAYQQNKVGNPRTPELTRRLREVEAIHYQANMLSVACHTENSDVNTLVNQYKILLLSIEHLKSSLRFSKSRNLADELTHLLTFDEALRPRLNQLRSFNENQLDIEISPAERNEYNRAREQLAYVETMPTNLTQQGQELSRFSSIPFFGTRETPRDFSALKDKLITLLYGQLGFQPLSSRYYINSSTAAITHPLSSRATLNPIASAEGFITHPIDARIEAASRLGDGVPTSIARTILTQSNNPAWVEEALALFVAAAKDTDTIIMSHPAKMAHSTLLSEDENSELLPLTGNTLREQQAPAFEPDSGTNSTITQRLLGRIWVMIYSPDHADYSSTLKTEIILKNLQWLRSEPSISATCRLALTQVLNNHQSSWTHMQVSVEPQELFAQLVAALFTGLLADKTGQLLPSEQAEAHWLSNYQTTLKLIINEIVTTHKIAEPQLGQGSSLTDSNSLEHLLTPSSSTNPNQSADLSMQPSSGKSTLRAPSIYVPASTSESSTTYPLLDTQEPASPCHKVLQHYQMMQEMICPSTASGGLAQEDGEDLDDDVDSTVDSTVGSDSCGTKVAAQPTIEALSITARRQLLLSAVASMHTAQPDNWFLTKLQRELPEVGASWFSANNLPVRGATDNTLAQPQSPNSGTSDAPPHAQPSGPTVGDAPAQLPQASESGFFDRLRPLSLTNFLRSIAGPNPSPVNVTVDLDWSSSTAPNPEPPRHSPSAALPIIPAGGEQDYLGDDPLQTPPEGRAPVDLSRTPTEGSSDVPPGILPKLSLISSTSTGSPPKTPSQAPGYSDPMADTPVKDSSAAGAAAPTLSPFANPFS